MILYAYASITDLYEDYVSRCGTFVPERSYDDIHGFWHQFGLEWGTFYTDAELDSFWNTVFGVA